MGGRELFLTGGEGIRKQEGEINFQMVLPPLYQSLVFCGIFPKFRVWECCGVWRVSKGSGLTECLGKRRTCLKSCSETTQTRFTSKGNSSGNSSNRNRFLMSIFDQA